YQTRVNRRRIWYTFGKRRPSEPEVPMTPAAQTFPPVSPEVLAFAAEQGVSAYLPAVLAMTQRLFPDARRFAVLVEDDPEIANDRHIVIEVDVTGLDAE